MKHFNFWQTWLLVVGWMILLMGITFAAMGPLGIEAGYLNEAFWENGVVPPDVQSFQSWIYGVYGATAVAFGIVVIFLARHPFKRQELWAWNCLALCFVAWFLTDTVFSVSAKVYTNAGNNLLLFIVMLLPLIMTRKAFLQSKESIL
jgi:hypothetical protein